MSSANLRLTALTTGIAGGQRPSATHRVLATRRRDLLEWAATAVVFLVCGGAVVYADIVGGWTAAVVAAVFIAAVTTVGDRLGAR